jgi:hypothetical protein
MALSEEERHAIGIALNEATLLGLEVDPNRRVAAATFRVLTLPPDGPAPSDARVQLLFHPVGRVLASLRERDSPDVEFASVPFAVGQLLEVVQSFGGLPVYGWEFIDLVSDETGEGGKPEMAIRRQWSPALHLALSDFWSSRASAQALV